jgi:outer membrane protein TolC
MRKPIRGLLVLCSIAFGSSASAQGAPQPAAAPTVAPAASAAPADTASTAEQRFDFGQALRQGAAPLDAAQAAKLAVSTSPTVARAKAANQQASEAADLAQVAVYPRLDLEARYTRVSEQTSRFRSSFEFSDPDTGDPVPNPTTGETPWAIQVDGESLAPLPDQYTLQARLSYPVSDLFFQILPRYSAARRAADAQAFSAKAEEQTIALQAKEVFYNYARARAALLVAESGLAQSQAQRRDVDALVRAGTLARVELMRADAGVAAAEVAVARAAGAVAVARTALRSLLHQPGDDELAITEDLATPAPALTETKDGLLAQALRTRSELQALRTMLEVHDTTIDASEAEQLPKLSVGANVDLANPNLRVAPFERKWGTSWALVGILSWSPNDFAMGDARADQVRAQRVQTQSDMQALEDALRQEVAQGYESYQASRAAMTAAQTGISAAEESYRVRREQFRAGAAVATDVVDAEAELRRARLELVNAAIDVRVARARIDRAVER